MPPARERDATTLIRAHRDGDPAALGELFDLLYDQLRSLAHGRSGRDASLNTTAVVHEVYLKLVGSRALSAEDRGHFLALSARAMRQVLVDRARRRAADKRGGGAAHEPLDEARLDPDDRAAELLELDGALERLFAADERLGRVVELRFFGGLTDEEAAGVLGVTDRTVRRDWRRARAFLYEQLYGADPA